MVTKKDIKFINSLKHKKFRHLNSSFIVEGKKSIAEFLDSDYELIKLFSVDCSMFNKIKNQIKIDKSLLRKISFLINPDDHLAIFKLSDAKPIDNNNLIIALESIRDPGNLGTIIRIADWFGIEQIVASEQTTDCYNPKTIQATMGSIFRVPIFYKNLGEYLQGIKTPIYGAVMDGTPIQEITMEPEGILVIGNEGKGISEEVMPYLSHHISIPRIGGAESLNAAVACGILAAKWNSL